MTNLKAYSENPGESVVFHMDEKIVSKRIRVAFELGKDVFDQGGIIKVPIKGAEFSVSNQSGFQIWVTDEIYAVVEPGKVFFESGELFTEPMGGERLDNFLKNGKEDN
ncbi:hypothetical protein SAMN05443429_108104 [Cruoricaptor ignavus]|uniref:Uncharacterized protein n=1 Tax=Cruoricaptor ignavus TaxID=1118202 RepID=A0A1M6G9A6_9FLAO|nr:hypothetical protein [Cruoricaptor ignavus]SHJ06502.1 hypothetical protein SAMN05443429_108104 [Cruoricaptor ignavus]